jgi:hypothetical protein
VPDDYLWKRRFLLYSLVRLAGLGVFFLGIAIAYGNVLRPGGWPQLGGIVAIAGAIGTVVTPRLLKRRWGER